MSGSAEPEADKPKESSKELNDSGLMQAVPFDSAQGKPPVAPTAQDVEALKTKLEEALIASKRWQAEFVNYQARVVRDRESDRKYASESLLRDLLLLIDAVQHSIAESARAGAPPAATEAMRLVDKELARLLAKYGVQPIDAGAGPFDPNLHDAISVVETAEHPDGSVVEVVRPGYRLHDRVLRPAQVKVARNAQGRGNP